MELYKNDTKNEKNQEEKGAFSKKIISMNKYFDITIPIKNNMMTIEGDPQVTVSQYLSIRKGDPCNMLEIVMGSHAGTHIDAPSHFFMNGLTADKIPIDSLVGKARVFLIRNEKVITKKILMDLYLKDVDRILFKTDHSFLRDRYSRFRTGYVYLDVEAADYLVNKGIKVVGIDSFSIEAYDNKDNLCHKVLLGAGVLILELLNLRDVEPGDYELICLPLKIFDGDGAPVRAILKSL